MPRKSEESATRRKPSAASDDAATATPKKKTAAKAAGAKTKSSGTTAAKKTAAKKAPAAKSAPARSAAKKSTATKSAASSASRSRKAEEARPKAPTREKPAAKPGKSAKKAAPEPAKAPATFTGRVDDPIGDLTDGEGHHSLISEDDLESGTAMMDAYRADTAAEAERSLSEIEPAKQRPAASESEEERDEEEEEEEEEPEASAESRPEPHLERLQKILSQAGLASRRHAEEMIVAGRVMVNGKVVTQLGAKADPARDHVRVDGKLIQGAERHRTFLLNKPKGYVTTVSDPEGRPTVIQFFEKFRERLYPVGRLDYQSEGLLLMTNDGELANTLTRAASGVEKTYLVKVSGQPTEEELDQLRSGVSIERDQAGSGRVRTAPASVRQVRPGQNPWYEVVLTEGRNRELRKMFQAIGHFVEKIRRVGYGPLVLDVEPGQFRELSSEEVNALRLTAEGKLKPRRPRSAVMLPKEAGRSTEERFDRRGGQRGKSGRESGRGPHSERPQTERPFRGRPDRGRSAGGGAERTRFEERPFGGNREGRPSRQPEGFGRPSFDRPRGERPEHGGSRERFEKPRGERPERGGPRERFERPREDQGGARERFARPREERGGERPRFGDRPQRPGFGDRPQRPGFSDRPQRPGFGGRPERPGFGGERPRFNKPRFERPERGERQGFGGEERRPREEFRPRDERAERGPRPSRFGGLRIEREGGGEWRPREGGERPARPVRREGGERPSGPPRREGGERSQRFGGGGRPAAGNRGPGNRGPGSGGGSRRPGFGGRPGGGRPRRDRG